MTGRDNLKSPDLTGFTILIILVVGCIVPIIKTPNKRKRYTTRIIIIACGVLLYAIVVLIALKPINANGATIVYITRTGSKYHAENCRHLYSSSQEIELKEALQRGYDDCSNCITPHYVPETIYPHFQDLYPLKSIKAVAFSIIGIAAYIFLLYILPYILWNRWKKKRGKR